VDQLNPLEGTILRILEIHKGRENALPRRELVEFVNKGCPLFPVNEREIRRVIKHLVEQHATWIGSGAKGYFMIQTDQELLAACKYYHGYALSLLHVEAKLRKMSLAALLGQISIEFAPWGTEPNSTGQGG
jgi:hypothetical protein